jgi:hypothetical protein
MEPSEIRDRLIGLLTAAYTAHKEDDNEGSFLEMAQPLLDGLLVVDGNVRIDSDDPTIVAEAVSRKIAEQMGLVITQLIAEFVSAFVVLGQEYEETGPDADVLRVLREYSLSLQSDE